MSTLEQTVETPVVTAAGPAPAATLSILYHHRTQGHGAEGVHITSIIRAFEGMGHRVTLVSPPGVDPFRTAGNYLYGAKKSALHRFWKWASRQAPQIFFEFMELGYNLFMRRELDRRIGGRGFSVVYERYAFFLWITAALAKQHGVPLVLEVNEISGIKRARPLILQGLAKRIEKYVFTEATLIVTVSTYLKDRIAELGVDPRKILVLPNGVDAEMFTPKAGRELIRRRLGMERALVVGFVGWIDPWDNLPALLEVFHELAASRPELRLLLIGDVVGKGVAREPIRRLIEKLGLTERITILPRVPREEIPAHIAAMDVCLIPDSNPFGSPVVLFEFMAMARPVVAPSVGPVLDVLTSGENGLIFRAHDRAALGQALRQVLDDEALRDKLGRGARQSIDSRHTWRKNAEAVLARLEEVHGNV